jgi:serine/threonine protein kinase
MGLFRNIRGILRSTHPEPATTHPELPQTPNESETTLVESLQPSISSRTTRYLKDHGKAAGLRVLAKLHLVDRHAEVGESESAPHAFAEGIYPRYQPVQLLGSGGNGEVHLCRDAKMRTLVAVKTIYHGTSRSPPEEARILHLLGHHTNIVQFHTVLRHPYLEDCMQLVFERCELGDLADFIDAMMDWIPETFLWHIFRQITSGLHYMHSAKVIHGDLKPANILLVPARDGGYPVLKIADFGSASINPPRDVPLGHTATPGFQPPESVRRYGPECDIWALGCIIYELATRQLPVNKLEDRYNDPDMWFHVSGMSIPAGTRHTTAYKHFCHYMAFHPAAPRRIDCMATAISVPYSKLLNYTMMRTLDTGYRTRITARELDRYLPVLEPLAHNLILSGQETILNQFDDGRDTLWRTLNPINDSSVFEQIFYVLALRTHRTWDMNLLEWGKPLLEVMDAAERNAAYQLLEDLVI